LKRLLIKQSIYLATIVVWRIPASEQVPNLLQRHVQHTAVPDELKAFDVNFCIESIVSSERAGSSSRSVTWASKRYAEAKKLVTKRSRGKTAAFIRQHLGCIHSPRSAGALGTFRAGLGDDCTFSRGNHLRRLVHCTECGRGSATPVPGHEPAHGYLPW
jgi:hypothetical protein